MQRLVTGDVAQIRQYGRNYVVLGKGLNSKGEPIVFLVKNGMLNKEGQVIKLATGRHPRVFVVKPTEIKRIHGRRQVDLNQVRARVRGLADVLLRMDRKNGLVSNAPSITEIVSNVVALNNN